MECIPYDRTFNAGETSSVASAAYHNKQVVAFSESMLNDGRAPATIKESARELMATIFSDNKGDWAWMP